MGKGTGKIYVVIGKKDEGKSKIVIQLVKASARKIFVYDHRREYLERYGKNNITIFYNRKNFVGCMLKFFNSNIIIEECTAFLQFQRDTDFADLLTGASHNGNIIYMMFHSIADCPDYILRLSDVCILFRTNDDPDKVQSKSSILAPYLNPSQPPVFIQLQ